ncbi:MAG: hypothetical protein ABUK01_13920 [Leptospirales bacterium]
MRNPFPDSEVIKQFLGLKDYFKKYQTRASFTRIREIAKVGRIIRSYGDTIAFDLLGSVNFGMADENSDVDMVLYLDCPDLEPGVEMTRENSPKLKLYESLVIHTLIHALSEDSYKVEIVDYINLSELKLAIENEDTSSDIISRFVFYRIICRGINKRFLHMYEKQLLAKPALLKSIEETLSDALLEFTRSTSHGSSFQKYMNRLKDHNIHIPESVIKTVMDYLSLTSH